MSYFDYVFFELRDMVRTIPERGYKLCIKKDKTLFLPDTDYGRMEIVVSEPDRVTITFGQNGHTTDYVTDGPEEFQKAMNTFFWDRLEDEAEETIEEEDDESQFD